MVVADSGPVSMFCLRLKTKQQLHRNSYNGFLQATGDQLLLFQAFFGRTVFMSYQWHTFTRLIRTWPRIWSPLESCCPIEFSMASKLGSRQLNR
jgi:hypothetical protein